MTLLVTGGAGFIGANFIHYQFEQYDDAIRIINVDAMTYAGNALNLSSVETNPAYRFIQADITDEEAIERIFHEEKVDAIVNFAAESHVDRSIENPGVFVRTNVEGTRVLLDAARRHWKNGEEWRPGVKFLQVSTDEVYGSLGETGFFMEETPLTPRSPYSASKAGADMLVLAYAETFGLPVNITRCSNNYGPYQFPEKLIPLMINNLLQLKPLPVYGEGLNVRDWLYVRDHCKAIDMVLRNGRVGEVYNVGGHNEKRNIELVHILIDTMKELLPEDDERKASISSALIRHVTDRKGHDLRYAIDPEKIGRELGWKPDTSFNEGIRLTVRWYLDNLDWLERTASGEYQTYFEKHYSERGAHR